jgi:hypothetical protein
VRTGARDYSQNGCVRCHGGPGIDWVEVLRRLEPPVRQTSRTLRPGCLPASCSGVINNGIEMTGMPGSGGIGVAPTFDVVQSTVVESERAAPGGPPPDRLTDRNQRLKN